MKVDTQIIQCFTRGFSWKKIKHVVLLDRSPRKELSLEDSIEQAKQEWLVALQQMEYADKDLLESSILLTTACEKRYIALIQEAKQQQFTAWDKSKLTPVVANDQ